MPAVATTEGKTAGILGEEMAGFVELGFNAVKTKTGRLSPCGEEECEGRAGGRRR